MSKLRNVEKKVEKFCYLFLLLLLRFRIMGKPESKTFYALELKYESKLKKLYLIESCLNKYFIIQILYFENENL